MCHDCSCSLAYSTHGTESPDHVPPRSTTTHSASWIPRIPAVWRQRGSMKEHRLIRRRSSHKRSSDGEEMFGRSAPEPPPAPANAETRFTLVELRKLHKQLVENKRVNEANEGVVVEILRVIAEMVVYGDNKSEMLFDFFCEKNMLSLFLELMRTPGGCPSSVHIQILQTLSILISCVRNDTSLYYLLSNNYINEIIIYPHDFINDESLCAQFASFMKTLSLKLNVHTVQFFFIEETGAFPILTRAVELLTIPDPMIRIASQNTILNVYRVEDSRARAYALQDEVMGIMFAQTVNFMDNQYHSIFKTCKTYYKLCNGQEEAAALKLEDKLDDALSAMEDWFFYLQDLLDLDVPVLRKALVHQLIHDFLLPVLLHPLMKNFHVYKEAERTKNVNGATNGSDRNGHGSASAPGSPSVMLRSHSDGEEDQEGHSGKHLRLSMVLGDAELEFFDTIELVASLSYLLQMLKIVTHQALQRAVLVTIFHPLSLDCRNEILRQIEATKAQGSDRVPSVGVALTPNLVKEAWDRLQSAGNPKVALIMMYIEHILLDRIVPTSIDSTPGNETMVQHQVDEDYLAAANSPAITPLRTLNDPKSDAIDMLQYLSYLPRREYCEAQCSLAAATQALSCATLSPLARAQSNRSSSTLSDGSGDHTKAAQEAWSSDLTIDEDNTATITADCDAEGEAEDGGALSRSKVSANSDGPVGIADESNPRTQKVYGRLERDGEPEASSRRHRKERSRVARNDMLMPTESTMGVGLNTADQLLLPALRRMDGVLNDRLPYFPEVRNTYSVEPVFTVLSHAQGHSITTVQTAAHLVYSLGLLVASARNIALSSAPPSKGNSFSAGPPSKGPSFSSVPPERPGKIAFPEGCDPSCLLNQSLLEYIAVKVREAGRTTSQRLQSRLEGVSPEVVVRLVREEVTRLEGQKWKRSVERMYQDVLLFLPPTQFSAERMGPDFDLPGNQQMGVLRKALQVFMLLRGLYRRVHALVASSSAPVPESTDDLCASITDKAFLCLEEKNILPANYALDSPFDMRGKRFLDTKLFPVLPKPAAPEPAAAATPEARAASPNTHRAVGSIWSTKRLFGSSSSSSTAAASSSNSNTPTSSAQAPGGGASNIVAAVKEQDPIAQQLATKRKILFVQDPKTLILVSCDKHDSKNSFKVLLAVPLLYCVAVADPIDVQRFKLVVRSTGTVKFMYPAEPEIVQLLQEAGNDSQAASTAISGNVTPTGSGKAAAKHPASAPRYESAKFLKAKGKVSYWQLNLRVESEQCCKLAVSHIEAKRREFAAARVQQLRRMLEHWAADCDVSGKDD